MASLLPLICPCALNIINPALASHLRDLSHLDNDFDFNRKRQGMFAGGSFEEVVLSVKTSSSSMPSLASMMEEGAGQADSPSQSDSASSLHSDGWGPLLTGIMIMPTGTGKGRMIQLADVGNISTNTANDKTTLTIKSKRNDLLFEGFSDSALAGANASEILRRACVYGQQRILNNTPDASKSTSSTSVVESMNVVQKNVYFAKREMEVNEKRKKAQERKERFMKESGGLKYTAIAMSKM